MTLSPPRIPWSAPGLSHSELRGMSIQFPSLKMVKSHKLSHGNAGIITVCMLGVKSHSDRTTVRYDLVIDFRDFPSSVPTAYVRNPADADIKHVNIAEGQRYSFAPGADICWICVGGSRYDAQFQNYPKDRRFRLDAFFTQLHQTLRNPNVHDIANHGRLN